MDKEINDFFVYASCILAKRETSSEQQGRQRQLKAKIEGRSKLSASIIQAQLVNSHATYLDATNVR